MWVQAESGTTLASFSPNTLETRESKQLSSLTWTEDLKNKTIWVDT